MKLGLIGYPLGHSWSPEIHTYMLGESCYELWPLQEDELDAFFERKDFDGINVTIPYKEKVIPYLDEIDPAAAQIGAVNTIVNTNGKLKGYNTDYNGFCEMLKGNGIDVKGKHVAIIGSGGVSKAVRTGITNMGGTYDLIDIVDKPGVIKHDEMYAKQASYQVIVNACPVGMAPKTDNVPVDLDRFENLEAVVDVIANPLRTRLRFEAECKGLRSCGGFEMLVRQAYVADIFYTGKEPGEEKVKGCMNVLFADRRNIVLAGTCRQKIHMTAAELAKKTGKTAEMMDQVDLLASAKDLKGKQGIIIEADPEALNDKDTMRCLAENGIVIWLKKGNETEAETELLNTYCEACADTKDGIESAAEQIMEITGEKEN